MKKKHVSGSDEVCDSRKLPALTIGMMMWETDTLSVAFTVKSEGVG